MRKWIEAIIILAIISLTWYGAEMLIYNYSQPSVVKMIAIAIISFSLAASAEKARLLEEKKREITKTIMDAVEKSLKDDLNSDEEEEDVSKPKEV